MKTNKQGIFQGKCLFFFLFTICETECERKSFPENVSPDILHQNISEYFHLMGKTELRRTNTPGNVFMFTHEKYNSWGKKSKKNILCFQREKIKTLFVFSWNICFFSRVKPTGKKMFLKCFHAFSPEICFWMSFHRGKF